MRMEEERIPKKILKGAFYNTRPAGRPRTRWEDVVQRDAVQLIRNEKMEEKSKKW